MKWRSFGAAFFIPLRASKAQRTGNIIEPAFEREADIGGAGIAASAHRRIWQTSKSQYSNTIPPPQLRVGERVCPSYEKK